MREAAKADRRGGDNINHLMGGGKASSDRCKNDTYCRVDQRGLGMMQPKGHPQTERTREMSPGTITKEVLG